MPPLQAFRELADRQKLAGATHVALTAQRRADLTVPVSTRGLLLSNAQLLSLSKASTRSVALSLSLCDYEEI